MHGRPINVDVNVETENEKSQILREMFYWIPQRKITGR